MTDFNTTFDPAQRRNVLDAALDAITHNFDRSDLSDPDGVLALSEEMFHDWFAENLPDEDVQWSHAEIDYANDLAYDYAAEVLVDINDAADMEETYNSMRGRDV